MYQISGRLCVNSGIPRKHILIMGVYAKVGKRRRVDKWQRNNVQKIRKLLSFKLLVLERYLAYVHKI